MQAVAENMVDAAKEYLDAGNCVLPALRGEKRPAVGQWSRYKRRRPTDAEISTWFAEDHDAICIICGQVSGNGELLDFDEGGELFDAWAAKIPLELFAKLVIETTQRGGRHVYYRCQGAVSGNMKLAQRRSGEKTITLIETRGEGGLFLCAPTDGYEIIQGDFCNPPVLSEEERGKLLMAAWELNECPSVIVDGPGRSCNSGQTNAIQGKVVDSADALADRPGDDFNKRGDVREILRQYGWKLIRGGENEHWCRPGKESGTSATLKDRVFYVFSTNAEPFESCKGYSPFAVYTLLACNGDYELAASKLGESGFGSDSLPKCVSGVDISSLVGNFGKAVTCTSEPGSSDVVTLSIPNQTNQPPRIKLIRADQIEMRPPNWLLRGMLEQDTLALIFGDPGCGKSFLAIDWACRVATGTPWRDHEVKDGTVIYIAGEGQQGFGRRIAAWQKHNGVSLTEKPLYVGPAVAISDPRSLLDLLTAIEEVGKPSLIVIDTLARCFGGGDENSTQDMTQFISACDALRLRYGCTVLVIHHTGHGDKNRARGAIALKAALDAEYRLVKVGDDQAMLTTTKMKDAEDPEPVQLDFVEVELSDVVDDFGHPATSVAMDVVSADISGILAQAKESGRRGKWQKRGLEIVRRLMKESEDGWVDISDWRAVCGELGMVRQNQFRVLASLEEYGEIIKQDDRITVPNSDYFSP